MSTRCSSKPSGVSPIAEAIEWLLVAAALAFGPIVAEAQQQVKTVQVGQDMVTFNNGKPMTVMLNENGLIASVMYMNGKPRAMGVFKDGHQLPNDGPDAKAAVARANEVVAQAEGAAAESQGTQVSPPSDPTGAAATPAKPSPSEAPVSGQNTLASTAASPAVRWNSATDVVVHRPDAVVEINGRTATVSMNNAAAVQISMTFNGKTGLGAGIKDSVVHWGSRMSVSGSWKIVADGRQVADTASDVPLAGGPNGLAMQSAKNVWAAMQDAKADAARNGKNYKPEGESALKDFIDKYSRW